MHMKSITLVKIGGIFGIFLGILNAITFFATLFLGEHKIFGLYVPGMMLQLYEPNMINYYVLDMILYILTGIFWFLFSLAIIVYSKLYKSKIGAATGAIACINGLLALEFGILLWYIIQTQDILILKKIIPYSIFVLLHYEIFLFIFSILTIPYFIKIRKKIGTIGGILLILSGIPSLFMSIFVYYGLASYSLFALAPYKLHEILHLFAFVALLAFILFSALIVLPLRTIGLILCGVSTFLFRKEEKTITIKVS